MMFMLTNRKIDTVLHEGVFVERIHESGEESAQPGFRIARVIDDDGSLPSYTLLPDGFVETYRRIEQKPAAQRIGSEEMFLSLYTDMLEQGRAKRRGQTSARKGDVLFFIHGFNYSLSDSLAHMRRLKALYLDPDSSPLSHLVYFSWPSRGALFRYPNDQGDAQASGRVLARAFERVRLFFAQFFGQPEASDTTAPHRFCTRRIHLAAHSMGNQVLEHLMHDLAAFGREFPLFAEALLLNADADWNTLEPGRPLHRLPQLCERVHVYNHFNDEALAVSQYTKNHEKRLGRQGPRALETLPPRTLVVDCTRAAARLPPWSEAAKAFETRAGAMLAAGLPKVQTSLKEQIGRHWGYLYRESVVRDLHAVLSGASAAAIPGREATQDARLFRLL